FSAKGPLHPTRLHSTTGPQKNSVPTTATISRKNAPHSTICAQISLAGRQPAAQQLKISPANPGSSWTWDTAVLMRQHWQIHIPGIRSIEFTQTSLAH